LLEPFDLSVKSSSNAFLLTKELCPKKYRKIISSAEFIKIQAFLNKTNFHEKLRSFI